METHLWNKKLENEIWIYTESMRKEIERNNRHGKVGSSRHLLMYEQKGVPALSTHKLFCRLFLCQWRTNSSPPPLCLPHCCVSDSVFRGKGMSGAVIHANTRHTTKQKLTRKCEFEGHLALWISLLYNNYGNMHGNWQCIAPSVNVKSAHSAS